MVLNLKLNKILNGMNNGVRFDFYRLQMPSPALQEKFGFRCILKYFLTLAIWNTFVIRAVDDQFGNAVDVGDICFGGIREKQERSRHFPLSFRYVS